MGEEAPKVWSHAISLTNLQVVTPLHGIVCLSKVDEDRVQGILFHAGQLLGQLDLNGRSACPSLHGESIEAVVQLYHLESSIYDQLRHLPRRL